MLGGVGLLDRLEGARAHVQGKVVGTDPPLVQCLQGVLGEVQSGGGRGHGPFVRRVNRLVTWPVGVGGRPVQVGGQGHLPGGFHHLGKGKRRVIPTKNYLIVGIIRLLSTQGHLLSPNF